MYTCLVNIELMDVRLCFQRLYLNLHQYFEKNYNRYRISASQFTSVDFNVDAMRQVIIEHPVIGMLRGADATVDTPYSFNYEKWVEWHDSITTYLKIILNINICAYVLNY